MARPPLTAIGDDEPAATRRFLEHVTRRDTFHRIDLMSEWEKARLYVLYNKQWLQPDYAWGDQTRTPFWQPIHVPAGRYFPMPVFNALLEPLQNEAARLVGAGYNWEVEADDASPRKKFAADLARDVLDWKRDELHWQQLEMEGTSQAVLFGTWVLKTGFEANFTRTTRVPNPKAVRCSSAGCSFTLAQPKIPVKSFSPKMPRGRVDVKYGPDPGNTFIDRPAESVTVKACLTCHEPHPLVPYTPSDDEARDARDFFGRGLGIDIPICDVYAENIPVYDFFPENDGHCPIQSQREWAEERIVPVEYVRERWTNGRLVEPESVTDLLRWHPIVSSVHGWDQISTYDHHCVLRVYHRLPEVVWDDETIEKFHDTDEVTTDRGRSVVMAGRHVMLDDHFQVESQENPGVHIDRVRYHQFAWEIREGEAFGLSAASAALPLQDTINTRLSQVQYVRHVFANPKLAAVEGSQLYQAGYEDSGYAGDILYYGADAGGKPPVVLQGTQLSLNWMEEHNADLDGIARVVGTHEVEVGQPPGKDVTAAAALMNLTRQAGTRRQPRVERRATMMAGAGKHILEWVHEGYRERRYYRISGPGKRTKVKAFIGAQLDGQCDVKVYVRPAHDTPEFRQQMLIDAVDREIIVPQTAGDKARLAREMGASTDVVNADSNRQVEIAEEEFVAFHVDGRPPVIRLDGDDHIIHRQQHLLDWLSSDMEVRKQACGWYEVESSLYGWNDEWAQLQQIEARVKGKNPKATGPTMPPGSPIDGRITATDIARSVEVWTKEMEAQQKIEMLPESIELRLFAFLRALVQKRVFPAGVPPMAQQRRGEIISLLRFFAHIQAHKQVGQLEAQASALGVRLPAAVGGVQDAQGMIPASPAAAQAGAGAGPGAVTAGAPS